MQTAVITGDLIDSRKVDTMKWLPSLKYVLNQYGTEEEDWLIFRGDSFQLSTITKNALSTALHIKSRIKQFKSLDVRMGIGIGNISYVASKISESSGSAFIRSGEAFEGLKKRTLAIKSSNPALDESLNIMLNLAMIIANDWTPSVAQIIEQVFEHPGQNQIALGQKLKKSQGAISQALIRGGFDEIMAVSAYFKEQISNE